MYLPPNIPANIFARPVSSRSDRSGQSNQCWRRDQLTSLSISARMCARCEHMARYIGQDETVQTKWNDVPMLSTAQATATRRTVCGWRTCTCAATAASRTRRSRSPGRGGRPNSATPPGSR